MSRTDIPPATLAKALRRMAGDGSIEWVTQPMQASVLLDVADALDENAKLRQEIEVVGTVAYVYGVKQLQAENAKLRELVRDMWRDGMCECDERGACTECEYHFHDRMRELGVEVQQ